MEMQRKIIVLTPVKNESWILPLFLQSTSIWADYIIIADQRSTDGSLEIYSLFPKVIVINNDSVDLDEGYRDSLLINKAREIVPEGGILFRIDADEIFTPSSFDSDEWKKMIQSEPGSVWRFPWINLCAGFTNYWNPGTSMFGAFVDDGRPYAQVGLIHSREMFTPEDESQGKVLKKCFLLHYQFTDWRRMRSKHRWYQCYEKVTFPRKSAIDIYRTYHWMYSDKYSYSLIPDEWKNDYLKYGIDMTAVSFQKEFWWDKKVEEYFKEYSPSYFWKSETKVSDLVPIPGDNRPLLYTLLLHYLRLTTKIFNSEKGTLYILTIFIDKVLKSVFSL